MKNKYTAFLVAFTFLLSSCATSTTTTPIQSRTERIYFDSVTPKNRFEFVSHSGEMQKVRVYGDLVMPENVTGPVPAVVLSHGSEGVQPRLYDIWAKTFNDAGYAVFIVDSFKPRGVASTEQQQGTLDPMANVADTLNALVLLANDPRIDKSRIANMGFSRGGNVAIDTYFDLFRHAVIPGDLKFSANIPVYPSCAIRYRADATNTNHGPMLLLMGGKDDAGSASLCASYIDELNHKNNLNIQHKIYPNGWHGFDGYSQFHLARGAESARNCNMEVQLSATPSSKINAVDKTTGRKIETQQEWAQTYRSCRNFDGYHLSGDTSIRAEAEKDAVAFLKNTFGK